MKSIGILIFQLQSKKSDGISFIYNIAFVFYLRACINHFLKNSTPTKLRFYRNKSVSYGCNARLNGFDPRISSCVTLEAQKKIQYTLLRYCSLPSTIYHRGLTLNLANNFVWIPQRTTPLTRWQRKVCQDAEKWKLKKEQIVGELIWNKKKWLWLKKMLLHKFKNQSCDTDISATPNSKSSRHCSSVSEQMIN